MSEKGKGLAILLGLGKKGGGDNEPMGEEGGDDKALSDAGDNLVSAIKSGDGAGAAQAVLDIMGLGD
jgi:hypothetical protein